MEINPIRPELAAQAAEKTAAQGAGGAGVSFKTLLADAVNQVNHAEQEANAAAVRLASGENVSLHEVTLAMQKADLALQLTMQVRNKLVDAYQEIVRMQI